jgi:hypothetical protein
MHALAVVYACELTRWGIETSIIVPGAFTGGTNHFAHAGSPGDEARAAEHEGGPCADFADQALKGFASIVPPDAEVSAVADAIVKVVDASFGKRPFRSSQRGFGPCPRRASSRDWPRRPVDTAGSFIPIEKHTLTVFENGQICNTKL